MLQCIGMPDTPEGILLCVQAYLQVPKSSSLSVVSVDAQLL
jgi:hypothetical protein